MASSAAFDLTGRTALVTGAGSPDGIGATTARLLVDCGARVVVTSTTERILERVSDLPAGSAVGIVADLTDPDGVAAVVEACDSLDILVNNAGMTSVLEPGVGGSIEQVTVAQWTRTLERNATTAFALAKAALPLLQASGRGRIINIASVTGPVMAMRSEVAYAAAKAAMVGMTRALAVDLGPEGITVNAIAPGWITTASSNEHERQQGLATPLGRCGTPEEIAGAVAWLASDLGGYTTGQVLVIDGGNSIAEERA